MAIYIGGTELNSLFSGGTQIEKVYSGADEVWSNIPKQYYMDSLGAFAQSDSVQPLVATSQEFTMQFYFIYAAVPTAQDVFYFLASSGISNQFAVFTYTNLELRINMDGSNYVYANMFTNPQVGGVYRLKLTRSTGSATIRAEVYSPLGGVVSRDVTVGTEAMDGQYLYAPSPNPGDDAGTGMWGFTNESNGVLTEIRNSVTGLPSSETTSEWFVDGIATGNLLTWNTTNWLEAPPYTGDPP
jgi:hypothetical protein